MGRGYSHLLFDSALPPRPRQQSCQEKSDYWGGLRVKQYINKKNE